MERKEELWERYKRLMREEQYEEAKSVYRKYLKATDPQPLWRANLTLTRWKAWPRTMTPFLMNFPGFRKFNRRIVMEIEEAKGRLGSVSPSPPEIEKIEPPEGETNILYASSDYEPVTHAGTLWHDCFIVPEIERLGYRDKHLRDPAAQRPAYDALLDSDFTTGCGHGGECYDEDTEVLTENGWKHFYELGGEKVATLNPDTHQLEYQKPTHYFEYEYKGKMFYIDGKRVNLLVTPNHNLYVSWLINEGREWSPFRITKAENIGEKGTTRDSLGRFSTNKKTTAGHCLRFKRTAEWKCEPMKEFNLPQASAGWPIPHGERMDRAEKTFSSKPVNIEDWLRFFGVWLAEGSASYVKQSSGRGHYVISITQNDDEKREKIKKWVDAVCDQIEHSAWVEESNEHSKAVKFKSKQVYDYLKQFGGAKKKYIPKEIKMLPPQHLKILLDSMVFGDGTTMKDAVEYNTASKKLADDVQEIALKIGRAATITTSSEEIREGNRSTLYSLYITDGDVHATKQSWDWIDYEGKVYDVEVPNHLLYVRRNGKPCWSGNSVYTGGLQQPLLEVGKYDKEAIQGMSFKYLSCLLASKLLPNLVENGAKLAQGYERSYAFTWDPKYAFSKPENCPILRLFFLPYVRSVIGLLNGMSNREAFELERKQYLVNAERAEDPEVRDLLIRESDIMRMFGDPDARVVES